MSTKQLLLMTALGLLNFTASYGSDEFISHATCTEIKTKGKEKVSITLLEGVLDQENSADGLIILKDGSHTFFDKAALHFENNKFTYTIDADPKSPILKFLASGNTVALSGNFQGPLSDTLAGTREKFKCKF